MSAWLIVPLLAAAWLAGGSGWLALCGWRWRSGPEWLGLGLAAGAAWMALLAALLSPIAGASSGAVLLAGSAAPGLALLRRGRADRNLLRTGWAGFAPALLVVGFSFWLAAQRPVWNIDAQKRWALHGLWTAEYGTVLPERIADPSWATTHPSYPPLLPAALGTALDLGADRQMGLRPVLPLFFLALLAVIYGHARRREPRFAPWITLAFATTPCFAWLGRSGGAIGLGADAVLADVPTALFAAAFAVTLLEALASRARAAWLACAVFAAGAALTKQEGAALVFVGLITAFGYAACHPAPRREWLRGLLWPLGGLVLSFGLWRVLSGSMPVEAGESYLSGAGLGALLENLDRFPAVAGRMGRELLTVPVWGVLWLLPAASLGFLLHRRLVPSARRPAEEPQWNGSALLLFALAGATAMVAAAYVATGWKGGNYEILMEVSLTRLLMHHAPWAALLGCHLREEAGKLA